jgi:hypothetical protein
VLAALKGQGLLNETVGAGYIQRKWPPALSESGAWPLSASSMVRCAQLAPLVKRLIVAPTVDAATPIRRPISRIGNVHRELKRKHLTLSILWDEYVERNPEGYRYSHYIAPGLRASGSLSAGERRPRGD